MSKKAKKTTAAKADRRPTDIYQRITDLIVEKLAADVAPWHRPTMAAKVNDQIHHRAVNVETGKPYAGINTVILGCSPYDIPVFGTFKQIQALGGMVTKGAKSLPVVYWQKKKPKDADRNDEKKGGFILKYYNVFNVTETDLDLSVFRVGLPAPEVLPETRKIPVCEQIVEGYKNGPTVVHRDQTRMCYSPSFDLVNMPDQARYHDPQEYYHILFHELVHSTGHSSRLDRKEGMIGFFGSENYSEEELTAELGASFLSTMAGIASEPILDNSASYLGGWLGKLKGDKMFIFKASSKAKKATEWILGEQPAAQAA